MDSEGLVYFLDGELGHSMLMVQDHRGGWHLALAAEHFFYLDLQTLDQRESNWGHVRTVEESAHKTMSYVFISSSLCSSVANGQLL